MNNTPINFDDIPGVHDDYELVPIKLPPNRPYTAEELNAPYVLQPEAPLVAQPEAPLVAQPEAPLVAQPPSTIAQPAGLIIPLPGLNAPQDIGYELAGFEFAKLSPDQDARWVDWPMKQIGEAMYDVTEPDWIVPGLFAKGSLILIAGQAKRGKKSLISIHMAMCFARGMPLFGLPVTPGLKVSLLNLEDGYPRVIRRFRDYGVPPGDPAPVKVLAVDGEYLAALELVKRDPPDVLFIDPLAELEVAAGIKSENDAIQITALLKPIRDLARRLNILIFLLHHIGVEGKRARGSSAMEGSTDGWINSTSYPKKDVQRLGWTLRDAQDGYVDLKINYQPGNVQVDIEGAVEFGTNGEPEPRNRRRGSDDDEDEDGGTLLVTRNARARIESAFQAATEPMTRDMVRDATKLNTNVVSELMRQLVQDKLIVRDGRRWSWVGSSAVEPTTVGLLAVEPTAGSPTKDLPQDLA